MRIFVRTDLERAARLAILDFLADGGDPEAAIAKAVRGVADEAPVAYAEETVRDLLFLANPSADMDELLAKLRGASWPSYEPKQNLTAEQWAIQDWCSASSNKGRCYLLRGHSGVHHNAVGTTWK